MNLAERLTIVLFLLLLAGLPSAAAVTGVMAEQYAAFGTIANRVQIGGVAAGGIARAEGTVRRASGAPDLDARDVLTLFAQRVDFQLLLRAELAVAFKLAPGAKFRESRFHIGVAM